MKKVLFVIFIITSFILSAASCNSSEPMKPVEPDDDNEIIEGGELESGEGNENEASGESGDSSEDESDDPVDDSGDQSEVSFIYSINSKKYHIPTCRFVGAMIEESRIEFSGTADELNSRGYSPCKTCKPDPNYDYESSDENTDSGAPSIDVDSGFTYAMNKDSMKFHYSGCSAVKNTNDENRVYSNASRAELVRQGYEPCGICKP